MLTSFALTMLLVDAAPPPAPPVPEPSTLLLLGGGVLFLVFASVLRQRVMRVKPRAGNRARRQTGI